MVPSVLRAIGRCRTIGRMVPTTLFDKIWNQHVVRDLGDDWALLHIDRHFLHDLSGPPALDELTSRNLSIRNPNLTFATPDHLVSSSPNRASVLDGVASTWAQLRAEASRVGVAVFDTDSDYQGIVHVMAPELGIVLPGTTFVCSDSHTCTNGAFGAIALGVGSSQSSQVLAAQVLRLQRPKTMRIRINGQLSAAVTAKDLALALIAHFGTAAATGCAVEFAGSTVRDMSMEERMTLCNLSVELGARTSLIAPDSTTTSWLADRPYTPKGDAWRAALGAWEELRSDDAAVFHADLSFDAGTVRPMVTWGTSPEHGVAIDGIVPDPKTAGSAATRDAWAAAIHYMGLRPGQSLAGIPIDWVFIGSCANSRLSDLRDAARIVRGRTVASHVTAWVVPGSEQVRLRAEAEGLHTIFEAAGFVWRRPGCSMCVAANGERVPPYARCVSTSNRNFVGRQGPNARTHLASPATAAASAIVGALSDARSL